MFPGVRRVEGYKSEVFLFEVLDVVFAATHDKIVDEYVVEVVLHCQHNINKFRRCLLLPVIHSSLKSPNDNVQPRFRQINTSAWIIEPE